MLFAINVLDALPGLWARVIFPPLILLACLRRFDDWLLWFGISVVTTVALVAGYHTLDNHHYLMVYMNWAACLSLFVSDRGKGIHVYRRQCQILLGMVMLFAASWKALSGEFLNGEAIEVLMLTDGRFQYFVQLTADLSGADLAAVRDEFAMFLAGETESLHLAESEQIRVLAKGFAITGFAVELLIAVLFLLPARTLETWRTGALTVLFLPLYFVLPVVTFGQLLVALAVGHLEGAGEGVGLRVWILTAAFVILSLAYWETLRLLL